MFYCEHIWMVLCIFCFTPQKMNDKYRFVYSIPLCKALYFLPQRKLYRGFRSIDYLTRHAIASLPLFFYRHPQFVCTSINKHSLFGSQKSSQCGVVVFASALVSCLVAAFAWRFSCWGPLSRSAACSGAGWGRPGSPGSCLLFSCPALLRFVLFSCPSSGVGCRPAALAVAPGAVPPAPGACFCVRFTRICIGLVAGVAAGSVRAMGVGRLRLCCASIPIGLSPFVPLACMCVRCGIFVALWAARFPGVGLGRKWVSFRLSSAFLLGVFLSVFLFLLYSSFCLLSTLLSFLSPFMSLLSTKRLTNRSFCGIFISSNKEAFRNGLSDL